jgi:hypothetical protein
LADTLIMNAESKDKICKSIIETRPGSHTRFKLVTDVRDIGCASKFTYVFNIISGAQLLLLVLVAAIKAMTDRHHPS